MSGKTKEEAKSQARDAVGLNELLAPKRYTAVNYGLKKSARGDWLLRDEILDAIDYILENDSEIENRLVKLRDNLTG